MRILASLVLVIAVVFFSSCNKDNDKMVDNLVTSEEEGGNGGQDIPPEDTTTIPATLPVANFTYMLHASLTVDFVNQSEYATSYIWDFGDNTISTQTNVTHTYNTKGEYTVTLTAANADGTSTLTAKLIMLSGIKMVNTSDNPYYITIDGEEQGYLDGGTSYLFSNLTPGSHKIDVKQKSGYILYATEETYTVEVTAGSVYTQEFPDDPLGK